MPFENRFAHGFLVSMTFNVLDWVVLDMIIIEILKPRWAKDHFISGGSNRHLHHARGFAVGAVVSVIVALAAAV